MRDNHDIVLQENLPPTPETTEWVNIVYLKRKNKPACSHRVIHKLCENRMYVACGRLMELNRPSYMIKRTCSSVAEHELCSRCEKAILNPDLIKLFNDTALREEHYQQVEEDRQAQAKKIVPQFKPVSPKEWAERLLRLRTYLNFSQAELADTLGITPSTIWRWESGDVLPSKLAFYAVAYFQNRLNENGDPE